MRVSYEKIWDSVTLDEDKETIAHELEHQWLGSAQAVWTGGTADGTLSLEASTNGQDWEVMTSLTTTVAGDGSVLWDITSTGVRFIRFAFIYGSGTGTINAWVSGKGV